MIEHRGSKWVVLSMEGKVLGEHDTEAEALAQLHAVEAAKHRGDARTDCRVVRVDRGSLQAPQRLANGWVRFDAYIGRAGLLEYSKPDGSKWIEYRPEGEAFSADSLDSFAMVPLTLEHPRDGLLTPANTAQHQRGTVSPPVRDGDKLRASVLATDAQVISAIDAGMAELSCGYTCDLVHAPGEWQGQHYDAIQTNVRGNHVALVKRGRAGPEIRLRVDSAGVPLLDFDPKSEPVSATPEALVKIKLNEIEFDVADPVAQALAVVEKRYTEQARELSTKAEQAAARADAAEAEAKKLQAALAEAPAKARAAVEARVALEGQAKSLAPDLKLDGLSDDDVRRAVAEHVHGVKLEGKSAEYVAAYFDAAVARGNPSAEARGSMIPPGRVDADDALAKARAAYQERMAKAHLTP